jgi:hypothetical protein
VANEHKGLFNDEIAPTFRLIVRFKEQYQRKMQRDLVNFLLSKTISIAKLDTSSIAFQMMAYLNINKVSNNNAISFFNNGCLHRLIVNSVSEGAQQVAPNQRFSPGTIYNKPFELIDVSVPTKNKMCDASKLAANEHKCLNKSDISAFQSVVAFNQQHQSTLQEDLADAWSFNAISIANLKTSNNFQQRVMHSCIHHLIVKLTPNTDSEGVLAQENILNATGAILTSEGARIPSSPLISGNHHSKISFLQKLHNIL